MDKIEKIEQVGLDTHVEVELIAKSGDNERMAFDIVRDAAADFDQGLLGASTPLAKVLLGSRVGATVAYRMGDIERVKILSVRKSQQPMDPNAADRRQAIIDQAVEKAQKTSAEIFASSFTSKWGGYDNG